MTLKGLIKLTQLMQEQPLTIIQWQILFVVADNPNETITDLVNEDKLTCGTPSDIVRCVFQLLKDSRLLSFAEGVAYVVYRFNAIVTIAV